MRNFNFVPVLILLAACAPTADDSSLTAFVGATLWDGTGTPPVPGATLVVQDGRVLAAGSEVQVPSGATVVDLAGLWIVPGLINTHGHVDGRWASPSTTDDVARMEEDLLLYARYGVTTVNSLGGGGRPSVVVRDAQEAGTPGRARLHLAGEVVTGSTAEEAVAAVDRNAALGADWIKIRVDDNLGTTTKMPPEVYVPVMARAREAGIPMATHLFYLDDAKALLREGTRLVAHSIRDRDVDDEVVSLLKEKGVCYVPTLVREVSTFVYAERPGFFDDPFFLRWADRAEMERVSTPAFQAEMAASPAAAAYRDALAQAQRNLAVLSEAGASVAFGTDSGPAARFPGYFEHMEMALMAQSGMSAEDILKSATGVAAGCLGLDDVGTLEAGRWADFLVLDADPMDDVAALRSLEAVYVGGSRIP